MHGNAWTCDIQYKKHHGLSLIQTYQHTISCTHLNAYQYCYNAHEMQCMKFLRSNLQNPSQKFHKNLFDFEKPQILQKSLKLRLQSMKCMKMRDLKLTKWRKTWISLKNPWGKGWRWVREVLGGEEAREIKKDRENWDQKSRVPVI